MARRMKKNGDPLVLKLKDWPPGDDFSELMPLHYNELFNHIPLPMYTRREGLLHFNEVLIYFVF